MKSFILIVMATISLSACEAFQVKLPTQLPVGARGNEATQDFIPYYTNGTEPHNTQWNKTDLDPKYWTPQQWVASNKGDALGLIQKWYNADIIRDQKVASGAPTLVVGPNFYHLSGSDKRKIVQTIDHVYSVTSKSPKMFYLEDWGTKKHIGFYSPKGLVLQ